MPKSTSDIGKSIRITGVAMTHAGQELFNVVDIQPTEQYSQKLFEFFGSLGFLMTEVHDGNPRHVDVNTVTELGI